MFTDMTQTDTELPQTETDDWYEKEPLIDPRNSYNSPLPI